MNNDSNVGKAVTAVVTLTGTFVGTLVLPGSARTVGGIFVGLACVLVFSLLGYKTVALAAGAYAFTGAFIGSLFASGGEASEKIALFIMALSFWIVHLMDFANSRKN